VAVDLTTGPDLESVLRDVEVVFDLSSLSSPGVGEPNPAVGLHDSVGWTLHVLTECLRANVRRVVYLSSGGCVYGVPGATPIPETHPTDPVSFYGVQKLAVEKYLAVLRRHGLDSVIVRPANVYGPHQDFRGPSGFVSVALARALAGEEITVWGDGSVARDYIFVEDVCDALLRLAFGSTRQQIYNVGTGRALSIRGVLNVIAQVTASDLRIRYGAARPLDVPANALAIERLRNETGWQPRVNLRDGIGETWAWLRTAQVHALAHFDARPRVPE
jgi:UDP-glucose 4-epimerase